MATAKVSKAVNSSHLPGHPRPITPTPLRSPVLYSCVSVPAVLAGSSVPLWGASLVAQTEKNLPAMQETWVLSWIRKIPWRRKWLPTPVRLPGESHGQRGLAGCFSWSHKKSHIHVLIYDIWSFFSDLLHSV